MEQMGNFWKTCEIHETNGKYMEKNMGKIECGPVTTMGKWWEPPWDGGPFSNHSHIQLI